MSQCVCWDIWAYLAHWAWALVNAGLERESQVLWACWWWALRFEVDGEVEWKPLYKLKSL